MKFKLNQQWDCDVPNDAKCMLLLNRIKPEHTIRPLPSRSTAHQRQNNTVWTTVHLPANTTLELKKMSSGKIWFDILNCPLVNLTSTRTRRDTIIKFCVKINDLLKLNYSPL